jgi:Tfp pilus assembly protein PilO
MTRRDRLVVSVLAAAVIVVLAWLAIVSPKRHDATQLKSQLTTQQSRLSTAQSQVQQGLAAEAGYRQNLRAVAQLYRSVPANDGVPNLLISLTNTSSHKQVDFRVLQVAAASPSAAGAAPSAAAGGLQTISFTFQFAGNYISLQHFLHALDGYTLVRNGSVVSSGRLLTIQGVGLTPVAGGATASVTAVAYSQPAASTLSGTPGAPAAQPTSSTTTGSTR